MLTNGELSDKNTGDGSLKTQGTVLCVVSPPWEVYDCPKTIKDPFQFSFPVAKPIEGNISDDLFIGIGIGAHLGIGGHASIGFNANKFWEILTE